MLTLHWFMQYVDSHYAQPEPWVRTKGDGDVDYTFGFENGDGWGMGCIGAAPTYPERSNLLAINMDTRGFFKFYVNLK